MEEHVYSWIHLLIRLPAFLIRVLRHFMPQDLLAQILDAALEMNLETYVRILTSSSPYLSHNLRNQALDVFRLKRDIRIINSLARYLKIPQLRQALAISKEIDDPTIRAEVIVILFKHSEILRDVRSKALLYEALAIALSIQNAPACAKALAALAPHLTKELVSQGLTKISEIQDENIRVLALTILISRSSRDNLSEDLLIEAFKIAVKIEKADACIKALDNLIPYLPRDLHDQALLEKVDRLIELGRNTSESDYYNIALEAIMKIHDEALRVDVLTKLAPHLPMELGAKALSIAQAIQDEPSRAETLAILSSQLPSNLLSEALILARKIENRDARAQALAALASRLAELPIRDLYPLWDETLRYLARRTRDDLITDLEALEPIIRALGGEEAIIETRRAIQDVTRW